jgi:hypothetical protein
MKKINGIKSIVTTSVFTILFITQSFGQDEAKGVKYRRSSLHTILVESDKFPKKDVVINAYSTAPFPDKYNDHSVGARSFNPADAKYALTEAEITEINKEQSKAAALAEASLDPALLEMKYMPYVVNKYLKDTKLGNQLVAKWFNRDANGAFNMDLIKDRGCFDASVADIAVANASARGTSALDGAGKELIPNTFVVINRMNFVDNEVAATIVLTGALVAAGKAKSPVLQKAAKKSAQAVYEKTKDGYTVWVTSYLYSLDWSDSLLYVFYKELWTDGSDAAKVAAFDASDAFSLGYVGTERASGLVLPDLTGKRTEDETIQLATVRAVDAVYAKLQKKYEVFRTKTPLYSGNPIIAQIGLKEGLEKGAKFEVLEATLDPKTGVMDYKKKGTITAQDPIWDNNYGANEDAPEGSEDMKGTTFKGGKKFYSGMLIRQLK